MEYPDGKLTIPVARVMMNLIKPSQSIRFDGVVTVCLELLPHLLDAFGMAFRVRMSIASFVTGETGIQGNIHEDADNFPRVTFDRSQSDLSLTVGYICSI